MINSLDNAKIKLEVIVDLRTPTLMLTRQSLGVEEEGTTP